MEGTVAISIELFEEFVTAKLRCQMVEKTVQKARRRERRA